jgi:putative chitinase
MNQSQFQRAAGLDELQAARWFVHITAAIAKYGIVEPVDQAMFIAQIGHESGGFRVLVENLNYVSNRLVPLFGSRRITQQQASKYGRTASHPANQEAIANIVYGGEWGRINLGNTEPGDGWQFRGRGLIQITGRSNYRTCGIALGLDLLSIPDTLLQDEYAALSATWFYVSRGCLNHSGDLERITRIINGGLNGLEDRCRRFNTAISILA